MCCMLYYDYIVIKWDQKKARDVSYYDFYKETRLLILY